MAIVRRFAILAVVPLIVAACAQTTPSRPPSEAPSIQPSGAVPGVQVMTGAGADGVARFEPLRQIIPAAAADAATVGLSFSTTEVVMLGVEGAELFLLATDSDGTVVLDRIVDRDGDTLALPADDYTLTAYYRTCSGDCSLLDPAEVFCSVEGSLLADRRYRLEVSLHAADRDWRLEDSDCELTAG